MTGAMLWRTDPVLVIVSVLGSNNSHLVPVRVHGGQDVDAAGVDEGPDALVPQQVLWAQVLRQVDQQLAAQDFISVHVADVFHLGLDCTWSYLELRGQTSSVTKKTSDFTYAARVVRGCLRTQWRAAPGPPCSGRCCRFSLCRSNVPQLSSRCRSSERWSDSWTAAWWRAPREEASRCCQRPPHSAPL